MVVIVVAGVCSCWVFVAVVGMEIGVVSEASGRVNGMVKGGLFVVGAAIGSSVFVVRVAVVIVSWLLYPLVSELLVSVDIVVVMGVPVLVA